MEDKIDYNKYLYDIFNEGAWGRIKEVAASDGTAKDKVRIDCINGDMLRNTMLSIANTFGHRQDMEKAVGYEKKEYSTNAEEYITEKLVEYNDTLAERTKLAQVEEMITYLNNPKRGFKINMVDNRANRLQREGLEPEVTESSSLGNWSPESILSSLKDVERQKRYSLERFDNHSLYIELTPEQARKLMVVQLKEKDKESQNLAAVNGGLEQFEADTFARLFAGMPEDMRSQEITTKKDIDRFKAHATKWAQKHLGSILDDRELIDAALRRTPLDKYPEMLRNQLSAETRQKMEATIGAFVDSIVLGKNDEHSEAKACTALIETCNEELRLKAAQKAAVQENLR